MVEKRDGSCSYSWGPEGYFQPFERWPENERQAIAQVKDPVLDIGCGAGRHSLYLAEKGFDPVGIDVSSGAVEACRRRGLQNVEVASLRSYVPNRRYGSILLLGNNLGMIGKRSNLGWFFQRMEQLLEPGGVVIGSSHNVDREMEFRIWYKRFVTPWMEWLSVSEETLSTAARDARWEVLQAFGTRGKREHRIRPCKGKGDSAGTRFRCNFKRIPEEGNAVLGGNPSRWRSEQIPQVSPIRTLTDAMLWWRDHPSFDIRGRRGRATAFDGDLGSERAQPRPGVGQTS